MQKDLDLNRIQAGGELLCCFAKFAPRAVGLLQLGHKLSLRLEFHPPA